MFRCWHGDSNLQHCVFLAVYRNPTNQTIHMQQWFVYFVRWCLGFIYRTVHRLHTVGALSSPSLKVQTVIKINMIPHIPKHVQLEFTPNLIGWFRVFVGISSGARPYMDNRLGYSAGNWLNLYLSSVLCFVAFRTPSVLSHTVTWEEKRVEDGTKVTKVTSPKFSQAYRKKKQTTRLKHVGCPWRSWREAFETLKKSRIDEPTPHPKTLFTSHHTSIYTWNSFVGPGQP